MDPTPQALDLLYGGSMPEYDDPQFQTIPKKIILSRRLNLPLEKLSDQDRYVLRSASVNTIDICGLLYACVKGGNTEVFTEILESNNLLALDNLRSGVFSEIERALGGGIVRALRFLPLTKSIRPDPTRCVQNYVTHLIDADTHAGFKDDFLSFLSKFLGFFAPSALVSGIQPHVNMMFTFDINLGKWYADTAISLGINISPSHINALIWNCDRPLWTEHARSLLDVFCNAVDAVADTGDRNKEYRRLLGSAFYSGQTRTHRQSVIMSAITKMPLAHPLHEIMLAFLKERWASTGEIFIANEDRIENTWISRARWFDYYMEHNIAPRAGFLSYMKENGNDPKLTDEVVNELLTNTDVDKHALRKVGSLVIECGVMDRSHFSGILYKLARDVDTMALKYEGYKHCFSVFSLSESDKQKLPWDMIVSMTYTNRTYFNAFPMAIRAHLPVFIDHLSRLVPLIKSKGSPYAVLQNAKDTIIADPNLLPPFVQEWMPGSNYERIITDTSRYNFLLKFAELWSILHWFIYTQIWHVFRFTISSDNSLKFINEMCQHDPKRRFLDENGQVWSCGNNTTLPPEVWQHVGQCLYDQTLYTKVERFMTTHEGDWYMSIATEASLFLTMI